MQGSLEENAQKAKEKKGCFDDVNLFGESMHEFEGNDIMIFPIK